MNSLSLCVYTHVVLKRICKAPLQKRCQEIVVCVSVVFGVPYGISLNIYEVCGCMVSHACCGCISVLIVYVKQCMCGVKKIHAKVICWQLLSAIE